MAEGPAMSDEVKTSAFQEEIALLMSLINKTLYSNNELFLRKLFSTFSDAQDKIRKKSRTDPSKFDTGKELCIKLVPNKDDQTLTIIDIGVDMKKTDLVNNLNIIAKPGTKAFMKGLQAGADISIFGQFGVGFYLAYLIADMVTVVYKNNDDEQYFWDSCDGGSFTVILDNDESLGRGTNIILHLKKKLTVNLKKRIINIKKDLSELTDYPIKMTLKKENKEQLSEDEEEEEEKDKDDDDEPEIEILGDDEDFLKKEKKKKRYTVFKRHSTSRRCRREFYCF